MKSFLSAAIFAVFSLCLSACDYARGGGSYRMAFQSQTTHNSPASVKTDDAEELGCMVEQWLVSKGFEEFKFRGRQVWRKWQKSGAHVYLWQEGENEVILHFRAMGYARDLRLSERIEKELLTYVKAQPGLTITPTRLPATALGPGPLEESHP